MKGTDYFKIIIKSYLDERAAEDELFRSRRERINRPIDDIVTYILNEVKNSGRCGWTDDEVFSLAVHAAEEENLSVGNKINCNVVVNRHIELTEEEKAQQRAIALKRYQDAELRKMQERSNKTRTAKSSQPQLSLFDEL